MEYKEINFTANKKDKSSLSGKTILLLEPIKGKKLSDYKFDIYLLGKDFSVYEISETLHFVYQNDVKDFFKKHSEKKIYEIPPHLFKLNEAALL